MKASAPLLIRKNPLARRISLRLDARGGHFILTLPQGVSTTKGMEFARSQSDWMERTFVRMPQRLPFLDGAEVPILGVIHQIRHLPDRPARVTPYDDGSGVMSLIVGGPAAGLEIRILNWLRKLAKSELTSRANAFCADLGIQHSGLSVGDPKSRWGSCSSSRALAFSWRLIMTPPEVISYVAAHEVAHLKEMNHSQAFWKIVGDLLPGYTRSRRWLKTHAGDLTRYGPAKELAPSPSLSIISF